jgi:hypothetical protein
MKATKHRFPQPDGPAKLSPDHVQDRGLTHIAGAPKGWRRLSPLESAFEKNQLAGGNAKYDAPARYNAGKEYEKHWLTSVSSGRDSTDIERVCSGPSVGLSEAQQDSIRWLVAVHANMGVRDRKIILRVCGEGFWPSEAVSEACGTDYAKSTLARFREATDALIEAIDSARRYPRRVNLG